jgi:hypothetical protein
MFYDMQLGSFYNAFLSDGKHVTSISSKVEFENYIEGWMYEMFIDDDKETIITFPDTASKGRIENYKETFDLKGTSDEYKKKFIKVLGMKHVTVDDMTAVLGALYQCNEREVHPNEENANANNSGAANDGSGDDAENDD